MRTLLLVLCASASLLVVALLFWGMSASPQPPAETRASGAAAPITAPAESLSDGEQSRPATLGAQPAAARREAAVPSSAGADASSDLPPLADLSSGVAPASIAPASIEQMRAREYERFAKKYDTVGAAGRKLAREAIQEILRTYKADLDEGGAEKGKGLSEEDITAFDHELDWIEANPSP